jgi:hypothetical protein
MLPHEWRGFCPITRAVKIALEKAVSSFGIEGGLDGLLMQKLCMP